MKIFARLEVIEGRQILAELVDRDEGPHVRVRRDAEVTAELSHGPWPDSEAGWQAAEEALAGIDMEKAAMELDAAMSRLIA